jgi:hypothetical protein
LMPHKSVGVRSTRIWTPTCGGPKKMFTPP